MKNKFFLYLCVVLRANEFLKPTKSPLGAGYIDIAMDQLLRSKRSKYLIPPGYNADSVLQKVEESVRQAEVNESAQAREESGLKCMMDYICSEKNVWTPKYVGNKFYPWVYQIPLALQNSLY